MELVFHPLLMIMETSPIFFHSWCNFTIRLLPAHFQTIFYFGERIVSNFGNNSYLCENDFQLQYFQTRFLEGADKFIAGLDRKAARKVLYNIDLAQQSNDPKLFKKLHKDIWEFRTSFGGQQIRLLAFWDKDKET